LAEGFRQAGFRIVSATDIDAFAGETFRENFPEASFFQGPIGSVDPRSILRNAGLKKGELDCLIGGPPCQAFSYNNHSRSADHVRAGLFRHYLRIVEALEPKCLMMENVPGILTVGGGSVVKAIFRKLAQLGYECDARILYAEEFGVPQERRRVFFVATKLGWDEALFPDGEYGPVEKPSLEANKYVHRWRREEGRNYGNLSDVTVWSAISDLPRLENGGGEIVGRYRTPPRTEMQRRFRSGATILHNHVAPRLAASNLARIRHVPEGGSWRDIPFHLLPPGMQRADRNSHTKRYGRLKRDARCCTILTKCDPHWGSYIHPKQDRAISVREAARLQSFPDRFVFTGPRKSQFAQVGNAVPPWMAAGLARALQDHLAR
jgi:DNA (cytosine-5)-methyltransferase 1